MAEKTDIKNDTLLPWDEYLKKDPDDASKSLYIHASEAAKQIRNWYWDSIQTKRNTSLTIRFFVFLLLVVGTALPILAAMRAAPEDRLVLTQIGVAALAIAGLLQIADRVFGWSSGWLRYVTTVTAMESRTRKFELEWAAYMIGKIDQIVESDLKLLFELSQRLLIDIQKLQSEETDKWVTEFNTGMALLDSAIKSQRDLSEKAVETARAVQQAATQASDKAKQTGALEVTLSYKDQVTPVKIALDDDKPEDFLGTAWARTNIAPGMHTIHILTSSVPPQAVARIVKVVGDTVTPLEIKIIA